MSTHRITLVPARCPQCQQTLSVSDWVEEAIGLSSELVGEMVLQCETQSCPQAGAHRHPLTLFAIAEHDEPARSEDNGCDAIVEEPYEIGSVDEYGLISLISPLPRKGR